MIYHSLQAIQKDLSEGNTSCVALTSDYIQRINDNKEINAFLEVFEEESLQRASEIDLKLQSGTAGKLAGMVIGIKDNICYKAHRLSASSKILQGFESQFSATVVERLLAEDAIIIGRLNCDEFAMGSTNENSAFGPVLNPLNKAHVPGGSSGGSAAAVAAHFCLATLGSDTGGSIRQPASFCGLVGYKPTYGRVSRWGLIAYASSFDQIGPLTHSVSDAERIMEVISGPDEHDSTCSSKDPMTLSPPIPSKGTIGYLKSTLESPALDPEIKAHLSEKIVELKALGYTLKEVDFPYLDYLVPTYYILTTAEASSNLSRYDGVHFGYRSDNAEDIPTTYKKSRSEGFGEEVKRRIMLGTFVLSAGYYDAYYTKAQKVRRLLSETTNTLFNSCDILLSPTSPNTALKLGQNYDDPTQLYLEDIFTVYANIVGIPAISLPTGQHSNGLPFGIQFMAPAFKDEELLAFANQIMNT